MYNSEQELLIPIRIQDQQWRRKFDQFLLKRANQYLVKLSHREITSQQMKVNLSRIDLFNIFIESLYCIQFKCLIIVLYDYSRDIALILVSKQNLEDHKLSQINQFIQEVDFMLKKSVQYALKNHFPRNTKFQVSQEMNKLFSDYNGGSDIIEADTLVRMGFIFNISSNSENERKFEILKQIEQFVNQLIRNSKELYPSFVHFLKQTIPSALSTKSQEKYERIVENSYNFQISSKLPKDHPLIDNLSEGKLKLPTIQIFRVFEKWITSLNQTIQQPEQFLSQRRFLKQIRKINQQEKQVSNNCFSRYFSPKNSKKQRSPRKTIRYDSQFKRGKDKMTINSCNIDNSNKNETYLVQNFRFKITGHPINKYIEILSKLNLVIFKKQKKTQDVYQQFSKVLKAVTTNKITEKFTLNQKKIYALSKAAYQLKEQILLQRLIYLIDSFLSFKKQNQSINQTPNYFRNVDLIQFKVNDLFRAKIIGGEKILCSILQAFENLHRKKEIRILKIKNRFEFLGDAMINFTLKACPINCELQLILAYNSQEESVRKKKAQESIHHYFYEINRAVLGPLSQIFVILERNDLRISYLQQIRKHKHNLKQLKCDCGLSVGKFHQPNLHYSLYSEHVRNIMKQNNSYNKILPDNFVCSACELLYKANQNLFPIQQCIKCEFRICSECEFQSDSETENRFYRDLLEAIVGYNYKNSVMFEIQGEHSLDRYTQQIKIGISQKMIRMKQNMKPKQFWSKVRKVIEGLDEQEYSQSFDIFCILIHPSLLPLLFYKSPILLQIFKYNSSTKIFSSLYAQGQNSVQIKFEQIDEKSIKLNEFDAMIPIRPNGDLNLVKLALLNLLNLIQKDNVLQVTRRQHLQDSNKIIKKLKDLKIIYDTELQLYDQEITEFSLAKITLMIQKDSLQILQSLKFINLNKNRIPDISDLSKLKNLEDLRISGNYLRQVNITFTKFVNLRIFEANNSHIKNLKIVSHAQLRRISVQNNQFQSVHVSHLKNLHTLAFGNEKILKILPNQTNVTLSHLPQLDCFLCSNIKLTQKSLKSGVNIFNYQHIIDQIHISNSNCPLLHIPSVISSLVLNKYDNENPVTIKSNYQINKIILNQVNLECFQFPKECEEIQLNPKRFNENFLIGSVFAPKLKRFKIGLLSSEFPGKAKFIFTSFEESDFSKLQELELEGFGYDPEIKINDFSRFRSLKQLKIKNGLCCIKKLPTNLKILSIVKYNKDVRNSKDSSDSSLFEIMKVQLPQDLTTMKLEIIQLKQVLLKQFWIPLNCAKLSLERNNLQNIYISHENNKLNKLTIQSNKSMNLKSIQTLQIPNLQHLLLSNMDIIQLNFKLCKKLRILDLRSNKINKITWISPQQLPNLQRLILTDNSIVQFHIGNFEKLKYILASNNPLNLDDFTDYLKQNNQHLKDLFENLQTLFILPLSESLSQSSSLQALNNVIKNYFENIKQLK